METGGQIHQQTTLGNQLIQSNEKILVQPQMGNQEQWHQVQSVNNNVIAQEQQLVSGLMNQQYRQQMSYPNHIMKTERNETETKNENDMSGSIRSAESPVVTEDKQLDPSEVVNVAPPVSQMLTPQSSCSSGYPSPAALQQQFTQSQSSSSPNESSHSPHNQDLQQQQVQQQQVQQQQVAAPQQPDEARTNGLIHSFSMTPIHLHSL